MSSEAKAGPSAPRAFHLGHRRSLDGLRGLAVALVIAAHEYLVNNTFGLIGVDIFFVLSGFLITCLLLSEWDQSGGIALKFFYARRALRLLPALGALLVAFVIFGAITHTGREFQLDLREAAGAMFYSSNWIWAFDLTRIILLRHTWSLSIEEQFYLLWPVVLLWMLRRSSRASLFCYALLGAFLSWLIRVLLFVGTPAALPRLYAGLDTRADSLLIGCAVAIALASGLFPKLFQSGIALRNISIVSIAGLGLIGQFWKLDAPSMYCLGWFMISFFAGLIVPGLTANPGGVMQRLLENRVLVGLGKISYGLYLWHWPVLLALDHLYWPQWKIRVIGTPIFFATTLASYYLLELPCLRLKRRFSRKED